MKSEVLYFGKTEASSFFFARFSFLLINDKWKLVDMKVSGSMYELEVY